MKIYASNEIQPPEVSRGCYSEYGQIFGNYPFDINEVEYKIKDFCTSLFMSKEVIGLKRCLEGSYNKFQLSDYLKYSRKKQILIRFYIFKIK